MLNELLEQEPGLIHIVMDYINKQLEILGVLSKNERLIVSQQSVDIMTEQAIKATNHAPSCSKGCAFCCHIHVVVSKAESDACFDYAKEKGFDIDRKLLEAQQGHDMLSWKELPYPLRKCVFLDKNNECSVYSVRPLMCRKYYVITPPSQCDTKHLTKGSPEPKQVLVGAHINVETIVAAYHIYESQANENLIKSFSEHESSLSN